MTKSNKPLLFNRKFLFNLMAMLFTLSFSCSSVRAGSFDKGSTTGTLAIGSGQLFRENYLIIGVGVGHYVIDGLEVGLEVDAWTGGDPSIYEVTPKITYVIDNPSKIKPYVGTFYNRTFIENRQDSDSYGYRAGFYTPVGERLFIGVGLVYTKLQDCTDSVFVNCSDSYSELRMIFSL